MAMVSSVGTIFLAVGLLGGCTRTAEVLTRQMGESHSTEVTGADSFATQRDSGSQSVDTGATSLPSSSTDPDQPSGVTSEAVASSDTTDEVPVEPLTPPPLAIGTGDNTTCLFGSREQTSALLCFGERSTEPVASSEGLSGDYGKFATVAGGSEHVCVMTHLGEVHCWGDNSRGQLGNSRDEHVETLVAVDLPEPARQLTSGDAHVCIVGTSQALYCWGANAEGQLGLDDSASEQSDAGPGSQRAPALIDAGPWVSVGAGHTHTCGVKSDGSLWCWGRNTERQVSENGELQVRAPQRVNTDHSWAQVAAGETHTCALRNDGTMWCWGSDVSADAGYPLGSDSNWQLPTPTRIGEARWRDLVARSSHTCAISVDDELWCWGANEAGQLGTGDRTLRRQPTFVFPDVGFVTLGLRHTCVVTRQGDVLCTGSNEFDQLGLPNNEPYLQFTSLRDEWLRLLNLSLNR